MIKQLGPLALGIWSMIWFIFQLIVNPWLEPNTVIKLAEITLATYGIVGLILIMIQIIKDGTR